jgi:hypothetical protein
VLSDSVTDSETDAVDVGGGVTVGDTDEDTVSETDGDGCTDCDADSTSDCEADALAESL